MSTEISLLILTAATIGFLHTIVGPDHYLPFIAMAKSGSWTLRKTAIITTLCGIGHVLGSVVIGGIGIAFGITLSKLEFLEAYRGNIAAWLMIAFGLVYCVWGIRRAIRNRPHRHMHSHDDGVSHTHTHNHHSDHLHPHPEKGKKNLTPWILFTIFVFGPCEPLIPMLMYPAAKSSMTGLVMVTSAYAITTIATMLGVVLVLSFGLKLFPTQKLERYTHALAGFTILLCGVSIQFLGL